MVLNLELVGQGALLDVVFDDFGDASQDDEGLGELLGLDWRDQVEVGCVEADGQDWVHPRVQEGVLKLVLDDESGAYCLGGVLGNLVLAELVCDLSEVSLDLHQG